MAAIAAALLLGIPSVAAWTFEGRSATVTYEPPTADYIVGNILWNGGQGTISWDPASSAAEHDVTESKEDYLSEPVRQVLNLNASRHIHVDLVVKDQEDLKMCNSGATPTGIHVKLTVDGKLLGGSVGGTRFSNLWGVPLMFYQKVAPDPPTGYTVCMYRIPIELDRIPAGAQIKLTIDYVSPSYPVVLGMAGEARSQLRIAVYSEFESEFRLPERAGTDPSNLEGDNISASPAVAGIGFLAIGLPFARRRGAVAALLVLAAIMGSGCIGSKEKGDQSATSSGKIQQTFSDLVDDVSGMGRIVGLVHDDIHVPVSAAHISLLGTAFFAQSDNHGRFRISDIPPGTYTMRVDRKEYRSIEQPVTVVGGKLARVDILILPLELKEKDYRPHFHDYWGGQDSVTVLERNLGETCPNPSDCNPTTAFGLPGSNSEGANLILPGTYEVEVIVKWDAAQMGVEEFGLKVAHNAHPFDGYNTNYSVFLPRASGQSFRIKTNWEMADVGHQYFSTWGFRIYSLASGAPTADEPVDYALYLGEIYAEAYTGMQMPGQASSAPGFDVKVVLHRGVVPLEPPHPDHWKGQDKLLVGKLQASSWDGLLYVGLNSGLSRTCFMADEGVGRDHFLEVGIGAPGKIIPPGIQWLEVQLTVQREATPHFDWLLKFKNGQTPPIPYYSYQRPDFQTAPHTTGGTMSWSWKLPIKDDQADNMYAKRSAWYFAVKPADSDAACADFHAHSLTGSPGALGAESFKFTLTVNAHRTPM